MTKAWQARALVAALAGALAACTVGPNYTKPSAPQAPRFKELDGWKLTSPSDALTRGPWWSMFQDPQLDALERRIEINNQNLKAAEASYRQAQALVEEARAQLYPTLSGSTSVQRSGSGSGSTSTTTGATTTTTGTTGATGTTGTTSGTGVVFGGGARTVYELGVSASWELDVWGRVRRLIESDVAAAQASAADLASTRLSAQAALATDYFNLLAQDDQLKILQDTIKLDERTLTIVQNEYRAGTAARSDVITAATTLEQARASAINTGVQRALNEHAIAVLVGVTPAELSIAPGTLPQQVPITPPGLTSELLERRPDVAGAERTMASANAQIGVAIAAYYPTITLSASGAFEGDPIDKLFRAANRVWSLGAQADETIFDAGLRGAEVDAARATYDGDVATYRQTVLTAFQQVEDELATLRILEQESASEARAVDLSRQGVQVSLNEYQAGTVSYTSELTAQNTLLSSQQSALSIQQSRLIASVTLVQDLGGGWTASQLHMANRIAPPAAEQQPAAATSR